MHSASPRPDAPARGRRPGRGEARIGDEQARRQMLRCGEAKATGRRQLGFAQNADDESQALRAQTFLHGPQRIGGSRRLGEQPRRRLEAEGGKAVPVRDTDLAGEDGRPAPQDARRCGSRLFDALQPPHGEAQRKAERRRPTSRRKASGQRLGFTSCREAASRPRLRRSSTSAAPSVHKDWGCAESADEDEAMREGPRSMAVMRWRSSASTPALLPCLAEPRPPERRGGTRRSGSGKST